MNTLSLLILLLFEFIIGLGVIVSALEIIRGDKDFNIKGLVIWIIALILLVILWSVQKFYFPESTWTIKDFRRT